MTTSEDTGLEGSLHNLARHAWHPLLLLGVFTVALGVAVLTWPGKTLLAAGVLFGVYLVVSGVLQLFAAFGTHVSAALRILAFLSGIVSVMLGFFCFRDKLESILLLALWIGIGWLFRGISLMVAALSSPGMPARGWQALSGLITFIGGGVLIIYPFDSIGILTLVAGWWLVVIGIMEVIDAFQIRHRIKELAAY